MPFGLLIEAVRHHPLIILGTIVFVLIGAYVYVSHLTPLYLSVARLYADKDIPDAVWEARRGVMIKADNYLYTHATLLKSSRGLAHALESLDTEQMQTFSDVTNPMSVLYEGLEATVGKTDNIIYVSFKGPHPQEAADILNAVVDGYVAFNAEHQRETAVSLLRILEKERVLLDAEVAEKYQQVLAFRQQNEALAYGPDETNNIIMRQMDSLLTQLSEARRATRRAKHLYDTVESMSEDPSVVRQLLETRRNRGVTDPTVKEMVSLENELARLKGTKADILLELKPGHPAIGTLNSRIEQVKERIAELDQQFVRSQLAIIQQEYLEAKAKEEELAQQCEAQRQKVLSLNNMPAEFTVLQSDYGDAKQSLDRLDEHMKQLNITKEVGGVNVTVLEPARAATVPSEPKRGRLMAIALILGTGAGVGLGLILELSDQKLRFSKEISGTEAPPTSSPREILDSRGRRSEPKAEVPYLNEGAHLDENWYRFLNMPGSVTGAGWFFPPNDGFNTHPDVKATYILKAKNKAGNVTGRFTFRYADGYIDLESTLIAQVLITGGKIAQCRGMATVNGQAGYSFSVKATDEKKASKNDSLEVRIWAPGLDTETDNPCELARGKLGAGVLLIEAN